MVERYARTRIVVIVGSVDKLTVTLAVFKDNRLAFLIFVSGDVRIDEYRFAVAFYDKTVVAAVVNVAFDNAVDNDLVSVAVNSRILDLYSFRTGRSQVSLNNRILRAVDCGNERIPIRNVYAFNAFDDLNFAFGCAFGNVSNFDIPTGGYRDHASFERCVGAIFSESITAAGERSSKIYATALGADVITGKHHVDFAAFDFRSRFIVTRNCGKAHRADNSRYDQNQKNLFLHNILLQDILILIGFHRSFALVLLSAF